MLKIGERAPEFTLPDEGGIDRSLTTYLNTGAIVLYFYPADFSLSSARQACALRDLHAQMQRVGLNVLGVSPQKPASHAKFRSKFHLPFALLSDEQKIVIKMYGVDGPLGLGVRRATYLIDGSRRICDAVNADFRIGRHAAFVRKAIELRTPNAQH